MKESSVTAPGTAPGIASPLVAGETYLQVLQFYALQLKILDDGDTKQWVQTFTPDGIFEAADMPEPIVGREALAMASDHQNARHEGLILRHWVGQLTVEPLEDGAVRAHSYAMVYVIPNTSLLEGDVHFRHHTLCDDELVRSNGSWLVRHRWVATDGAYK
jgi:hypothetical protein